MKLQEQDPSQQVPGPVAPVPALAPLPEGFCQGQGVNTEEVARGEMSERWDVPKIKGSWRKDGSRVPLN